MNVLCLIENLRQPVWKLCVTYDTEKYTKFWVDSYLIQYLILYLCIFNSFEQCGKNWQLLIKIYCHEGVFSKKVILIIEKDTLKKKQYTFYDTRGFNIYNLWKFDEDITFQTYNSNWLFPKTHSIQITFHNLQSHLTYRHIKLCILIRQSVKI